MSDSPPQPARKPYTAPEVRRVKLEPQNVVLGICKTATGTAGPGSGSCSNAPVCSEIGS
jgi:hypothetical protein